MGNNFLMAQLGMGGAAANLFFGNSQDTAKTALGFTAPGTSFAQQFKAILERSNIGREADSNGVSLIGKFKKEISNQNQNPSIPRFNGLENSAKPNIMTKEKQSELLKNLQHSTGVEFLSNLKQYFMSSHHELSQISLGEGAVKEIETLLVGAGFHPEDIRGLIETLTQDEENGALNVSDLMDGVMALDPERIVTDELEIEKNLISLHTAPDALDYGDTKSGDASELKKSKVKAADPVILESALVPFLQTIFNAIGFPDERSASIIDAAEVKGEGIDTNQLIQQLEALQREGFWSGKSFQTTSTDLHVIVKRSLQQIEMGSRDAGVNGDMDTSYLNGAVSAFNEDVVDDEPINLADLLSVLKRMETSETDSSMPAISSAQSSVGTSSQSNLQKFLIDQSHEESETGREPMDLMSFISPERRSLFMEDGVIHQGVNRENALPSFQSAQGGDGTGKILLNSLETLASEDLESSDVHQLVDQLRSGYAFSDEPDAASSTIHPENEGGVSLRERALKTILTDLLNPGDEKEPRFEIDRGALKSSLEGTPENDEAVSSMSSRSVKNVLMDLLNPLDDGDVEALGSKLDLNSLIALSKARSESATDDDEIFSSPEERSVKNVLLDLLNQSGELEDPSSTVALSPESKLTELVTTSPESEEGIGLGERSLKSVLFDLLNQSGELEDPSSTVASSPESKLTELLTTSPESEEGIGLGERPLKSVLFDLLNQSGELEDPSSTVASSPESKLTELLTTSPESEEGIGLGDRTLKSVLFDLLNPSEELDDPSSVSSPSLKPLTELVATLSGSESKLESESGSAPVSEGLALGDRSLKSVLFDLLNQSGEVEDPSSTVASSPESKLTELITTSPESEEGIGLGDRSLKSVLFDLLNQSGELEDSSTIASSPESKLTELLTTSPESEEGIGLGERSLKSVLFDLLNSSEELDDPSSVSSPSLKPLTELVATLSGSESKLESESGSAPVSEGLALGDRTLKSVLFDLLNQSGELEDPSSVSSPSLKPLTELVATLSGSESKLESESGSAPVSEGLALGDRSLKSVLFDLLNQSGELEDPSSTVASSPESKLTELLTTSPESEEGIGLGERSLKSVLFDLIHQSDEVDEQSPVDLTELTDPVDGDDISPKSELFNDPVDSKQNLAKSQASMKTVLADRVQPSEMSDGVKSEFSEFDSVDDTALSYKSDGPDLEGRFQKSRLNSYGNNEFKKSSIEFAAVPSHGYNEGEVMMTSMGDEIIEPFINEDGVGQFSQGEILRHGKDGPTEIADRRSIKSFDSPLPISEKSDGNTSSDSGQNGSGFSGNPDMKDGQLGVVREKPVSSPLPSYITNQVFKGIRRAFSRGDSEIRLQLKPIELGKIFMTIDTHGDSIKVSVVTENQSAKELLAGHANDLKATLAASGIQIDRFDVEMGSDFSRSLADSGRQFNGSGSSNSGQNRDRRLRQTKAGTADQEGVASSVKLTSEGNALHFVA